MQRTKSRPAEETGNGTAAHGNGETDGNKNIEKLAP